jgi:hypothetical protein
MSASFLQLVVFFVAVIFATHGLIEELGTQPSIAVDISLTATSKCVCTTVPCPQAGYNNLTLGKKKILRLF